MLKKILISLGVILASVLAVSAATSSSQYVYYGSNSVPQNNNTQTIYQTPATKKSEYPTYNYSQSNEPVITTTVGQIPAGSYIIDKDSLWKYRKDWDYAGDILAETPVVWQKVEDNHFLPNTTLLLSRYIVAYTSWKNGSIYNDKRDWNNSFARDFLRTKFYKHISQKFKNAIVEVDIPYYDLNLTLKTVKDNFFVFSVNEWDMVKKVDVKNRNLNEEGKVINYDDLEGLYAPDSIISPYSSYCNYFLPIVTEKTVFVNSTRTYINEGKSFFSVHPNGYVENSGNTFFLRPAVNIKSSTVVKGPYMYEFSDCGKLYKRKFYEIVE